MMYAVYRLSDGIVVKHVVCPPRHIARNTPAGCAAIAMELDDKSQRVDVERLADAEMRHADAPIDGKPALSVADFVVDYQPPQPSADHEWRENAFNGRPRWVKRDDVVRRERRAAQAQRDIDTLEKSQLRPMRELAIDPDNAAAKQRLADIDSEIAAKRGDLQEPGPAR